MAKVLRPDRTALLAALVGAVGALAWTARQQARQLQQLREEHGQLADAARGTASALRHHRKHEGGARRSGGPVDDAGRPVTTFTPTPDDGAQHPIRFHRHEV